MGLVSLVVTACSGTSGTTGVPPITGIIVRADTLTAGKGCGRAPSQVFKYVVVVSFEAGRPALFANTYDCFADGAFVNLPSDNGSFRYKLDVFAYNEPAFSASSAQIANAVAKAGRDNPDAPSVVPDLQQTSPTWTTTCTATQQFEVQSLALCQPLVPGTGGQLAPAEVELPTSSFELPSGEIASCATGSDPVPEAGANEDAGDAGGGATDGGNDDAGEDAAPPAPLRFTTAKIRYLRGSTVGPTTDIACPETYRAEISAGPGVYTVEVGLIDERVSPPKILGTVTCTAAVSGPGTKTTASCGGKN